MSAKGRSSARSAAVLVVAVLMATAAPSGAQESERFYVGAGLGVLDYRGDFEGIGYSESPPLLRLYGGWQVRERTAVEVAVGQAAGFSTGEIRGSGLERLDIAADYRSVAVRGVFSVALRDVVPKWQRLTLFGTVGGFSASEKRQVDQLVAGQVRADVAKDSGITLGAGVLYRLSKLNLRASFEQLDGRDANQSALEIGTEFRF